MTVSLRSFLAIFRVTAVLPFRHREKVESLQYFQKILRLSLPCESTSRNFFPNDRARTRAPLPKRPPLQAVLAIPSLSPLAQAAQPGSKPTYVSRATFHSVSGSENSDQVIRLRIRGRSIHPQTTLLFKVPTTHHPRIHDRLPRLALRMPFLPPSSLGS